MFAPHTQFADRDESSMPENLTDLCAMFTQEELDNLLNGSTDEYFPQCKLKYLLDFEWTYPALLQPEIVLFEDDFNNPSPASSYEQVGSPTCSLSSSEIGSVSTYQSQVSSPTYTNVFAFTDVVMSSPEGYNASQSQSEDLSYYENSPFLPSSPLDSSLMLLEPVYTQNNFKQEAEVPAQRGPTKLAKKRIPQNSKLTLIPSLAAWSGLWKCALFTVKACKHVWQFLRDLLKDPKYRTWICWLDEKRGIFKILKPDETASAWRLYKSQDRRKDFPDDDLDEKDSKKNYPNMASK